MPIEPTREEVDHLPGPVLLEFGASWCPHCQAIQPTLMQLLRQHPQVRHLKIEDGPGQALGRSYRVKLWPTLVFQRDGQVICQLTRPGDEEMGEALVKLCRPDHYTR